MWVAFAFAKATHIFSAKVPVNLILYLLEQLTFWPLTSLLTNDALNNWAQSIKKIHLVNP